MKFEHKGTRDVRSEKYLITFEVRNKGIAEVYEVEVTASNKRQAQAKVRKEAMEQFTGTIVMVNENGKEIEDDKETEITE